MKRGSKKEEGQSKNEDKVRVKERKKKEKKGGLWSRGKWKIDIARSYCHLSMANSPLIMMQAQNLQLVRPSDCQSAK